MYAILISGLPAAGKTRFARWFADRRMLPMASKDSIKERLFDELGFRSREEKVRLDRVAFALLLDFAQAHLRAGRDFILEANFEDSSVQALTELLEKYECQTTTIRFVGDMRAIYSRFVARESDTDRHGGHVRNDCYPPSPDAPKPTVYAFEQFAAAAEYRGFGRFAIGELVEVDATDLAALDYKEIERRLPPM